MDKRMSAQAEKSLGSNRDLQVVFEVRLMGVLREPQILSAR